MCVKSQYGMVCLYKYRSVWYINMYKCENAYNRNQLGLQKSDSSSFIAKRAISIYVNLTYLGLKLQKYKENNKKISETLIITLKYGFVYNELGIIRKALISFYTIVSLLQKIKNGA